MIASASSDDDRASNDRRNRSSGGGGGTTNRVSSVLACQAPMLASLVDAGTLPPVEERLPIEPKVLRLTELGSYGGTLSVFSQSSQSNPSTMGSRFGAALLRTDVDGSVGVDVVKDYLLGPRSLTLLLREGMKWSDGVPFTAHDFVFALDTVFEQYLPSWVARCPINSILAVDDYTVQYSLGRRCPSLPLRMALSHAGRLDALQPSAPSKQMAHEL